MTERPMYEMTCQWCGDSYIGRRSDAKFCSQDCAYDSSQYKEKICKLCSNSYKGYNNSKYCSSECRKVAGNYKKPGPTKSATCVGCGEEFTRPISYASAMKYCSNKCSHKEQKSVRDKFVMELNDAAVVFHSTWEIRFAACCMRYGIAWRRYDGDDIETPVGNYRPDFIVGKEERVIEVKGYMNFDSVVKIETAQSLLGDRYLVITEKELIEFEEHGTINGEQCDVIAQHNRTRS